MSSAFLTYVEGIFTPAIQEASVFAHNLENDFEGAETGVVAGAFTAASVAYTGAGTLEQKAIAAIEALGKALLGSTVTIVTTAAAQTAANPTPAAP